MLSKIIAQYRKKEGRSVSSHRDATQMTVYETTTLLLFLVGMRLPRSARLVRKEIVGTK